MKKNIFFYGNCQTGCIKEIISNSLKNFTVNVVPCFADIIDKNKFINYIKSADIIVTQPIHPNYRNTDYLHTEFILQNARPETKIIIFPSIYFDFYYFDLKYKFKKDNELLRIPSDYHYEGLIECYINDKSTDDYFNNWINNLSLKSLNELENLANNSIQELERRENEILNYKNIRDCFIIESSGFIRENYKKKLLFYSMNHPTKYVFHDIAEKIVNYLNLNNNINYNIDPLSSNERGILYKCIQNVVEFNLNDYQPRLNKFNLESTKDIINKYFDIYTELKIKDLL